MLDLPFDQRDLAVRHAVHFLKKLAYAVGEKLLVPERNILPQIRTHTLQLAVEIVVPGHGQGPLTSIN